MKIDFNNEVEMVHWVGGERRNANAKATTRKPVKATTALYQMLQHGPVIRKGIEEVLFLLAQDSPCPPTCLRGYKSSMLSYHLITKRLKKEKKGRYTFYSLTPRGFEYAKERGIF
jgi:hypothetical protein